MEFEAPDGGFRRSAGTLMLHAGTTLVQVDSHIFVDDRVTPTCQLYATMTESV